MVELRLEPERKGAAPLTRPRISIVIPFLDEERALSATLEALLPEVGAAGGDVPLFLHADTLLLAGTLAAIAKSASSPGSSTGAFATSSPRSPTCASVAHFAPAPGERATGRPTRAIDPRAVTATLRRLGHATRGPRC